MEENNNEEVNIEDPNAVTREQVITILINAFKEHKNTGGPIRKDVYAYWERIKARFNDTVVGAVEENPHLETTVEGLRNEMKEAAKSQRFSLHSAIFLVNYQRTP